MRLGRRKVKSLFRGTSLSPGDGVQWPAEGTAPLNYQFRESLFQSWRGSRWLEILSYSRGRGRLPSTLTRECLSLTRSAENVSCGFQVPSPPSCLHYKIFVYRCVFFLNWNHITKSKLGKLDLWSHKKCPITITKATDNLPGMILSTLHFRGNSHNLTNHFSISTSPPECI